jgi:GNAT superfamily N-acetyltransferase
MATVRLRAEKDLEDCIAVLCRVHNVDGYPVQGTAQANEFLTGNTILEGWVAEQNNRIVGHVCVGQATDDDVAVAQWRRTFPQQPNIAVLERLFVDPDARGSGAASNLVKAALTWAGESGRRLVLFALVKDQAAMRLYRRLGWSEYGVVPFRYGKGERMDAVCFVSPSSG